LSFSRDRNLTLDTLGTVPTTQLAKDLRLLRRVRGITLTEIARQTGVDLSALCRMELGERSLPPGLAILWVRLLIGDLEPPTGTPHEGQGVEGEEADTGPS
jgi:hypothetical protein